MKQRIKPRAQKQEWKVEIQSEKLKLWAKVTNLIPKNYNLKNNHFVCLLTYINLNQYIEKAIKKKGKKKVYCLLLIFLSTHRKNERAF